MASLRNTRPRRDHTDRRTVHLHVARLDGTGLGTQEDIRIGLNEKRILHVACRMVLREIERSEIVPIVLDLRTVGNGKADAGKDIHHLTTHLGDGMTRTDGLGKGRTGKVFAG